MQDDAWRSAASYWHPPVLVDSAWHEHAPFAYWIVDCARPSSIVELGTHHGFSYFTFCEAVARLDLDCEVVATDSWQGDEHAGFYSEDVYASVSATTAARYPDIGRLHRGWFDDFVASTPDRSIDLLHIDGRHRYEDVRHDFTTWLPKMSERGVMLFHDTAERQRDFGVYRFWEEAAAEYPSFAFEHGHGLGVLGVGTHLTDDITRFFQASAVDAERIRATYQRLGSAVSSTFALERRCAQLDQRARKAESRARSAERRADDLMGSTSWRVTAPLRWASRTLRRLPA